MKSLNDEMIQAISIARPKAKRKSRKPTKSDLEKLIAAVAGKSIATRQMLSVAALLWAELAYTILSSQGPIAIEYRERVGQTLDVSRVQQWMARQADKTKNADEYRNKRTDAQARRILDLFIVNGQSIDQVAEAMFGGAGKLQKLSARSAFLWSLRSFAALVRLPSDE